LLPFGGRERLLEFFRQTVGNDADLGNIAGSGGFSFMSLPGKLHHRPAILLRHLGVWA
jgi:hypothetical protein